MSLEQALQDNTAAIHKLIAVMQSGGLPVGAAAQETSAVAGGKGTRKPKETPAPTSAPAPAASTGGDASINDGKREMSNRLVDDPQGTRYFHIAKHNTVAKVKPGEVIPNIDGMEEVTGTQYENLRMKYSPSIPSAAAAGTSTAAAPATSGAATASSPAGASSPAASGTASGEVIDGPYVMNKCKELHGLHGNDGLALILSKHVAEGAKVPQLVAKAEAHGAAVDDIKKLLALSKGTAIDALKAALAPAAGAEDNSNLFG